MINLATKQGLGLQINPDNKGALTADIADNTKSVQDHEKIPAKTPLDAVDNIRNNYNAESAGQNKVASVDYPVIGAAGFGIPGALYYYLKNRDNKKYSQIQQIARALAAGAVAGTIGYAAGVGFDAGERLLTAAVTGHASK